MKNLRQESAMSSEENEKWKKAREKEDEAKEEEGEEEEEDEMEPKQKLIQILISTGLLLAAYLIDRNLTDLAMWQRLLVYLVPYFAARVLNSWVHF